MTSHQQEIISSLDGSMPAETLLQHRKDLSYARMLCWLSLICGAFVVYFQSPKICFNYGPINGLITEFMLGTPLLAFFVFANGPASRLKTAGLFLTLPLALISMVVLPLNELFSCNLWTLVADLSRQREFSDQLLRPYRCDRNIDEMLECHKIGENDLRLIRSNGGATTAYAYSLVLTRSMGSYCHQILLTRRIPFKCTPTLVLRRDAGYDIVVVEQGGKKEYRDDVLHYITDSAHSE